MLDNRRIAAFIAAKRRARGLTQQEVAQALGVSFQAVSKWENGTTYPGTELLVELSQLLGVSVDELLRGEDAPGGGLTYSKAGVDIQYTDALKSEMGTYLGTDDPRVLNRLGAFASLYDIDFPGISRPVLVLKAEEPGSKQKIAMEHGYVESICHDMVNHLVNDIIVMGARPLAVLDTIVCGSAEKETVKSIVKGIADACRANECALVGGETSIQPSVVDKGTYILTSSIAGIVDRDDIIDGSAIVEGDCVLAIASNGLHTNGYSLVRMLMDGMPQVMGEMVGDETFLSAIMKPHTAYYPALKGLLGQGVLSGLAHITGGGIEGNLKRIMPEGLCAQIELAKVRTLPLFRYLRARGNIADEEMLRTFNCGVGMVAVVAGENRQAVLDHIARYHDCYEIGRIVKGDQRVRLSGTLNW